ncbi:MAG: Rieske (2Fe-2S) protein [Candidatus Thiodiazotropha taylori]|nr:Rieske (2Fe-2S) protein [Candidatus Thiodiazotropha taylori]
MLTSDREVFVCHSHQLREGETLLIDIRFNGLLESSVVLRYQERAYAYLNRCVHMNKRLDCEHTQLFDSEINLLRCSMHGLVFDPTNGDCVSEICEGKRLCALKLVESDDRIRFRDKRISTL